MVVGPKLLFDVLGDIGREGVRNAGNGYSVVHICPQLLSAVTFVAATKFRYCYRCRCTSCFGCGGSYVKICIYIAGHVFVIRICMYTN